MSQEIGSFITRMLSEKNMSQIELAKKADLSASYISRLVSGYRGNRRPSLETLQKLAEALDVPTTTLMEKSGFFYDDPGCIKEHETFMKNHKYNILMAFWGNLDDEDQEEFLECITPIYNVIKKASVARKYPKKEKTDE